MKAQRSLRGSIARATARLLPVIVAIVVGLSSSVSARELLQLEFDARPLTFGEKRFLQTALAFEDHYKGLMDGEWGARSQRALEAFTADVADGPPYWGFVGILALSLFDRIDEHGWAIERIDSLGLSFLVPTGSIIRLADSTYFTNWEHEGSSLSYALATTDASRAAGFHEFTLDRHGSRDELYTVRDRRLWITRATKADGEIIYTRSDFVNGGWSTIILSANQSDSGTLQAVASSISVGAARDLGFSEEGQLAWVIDLTLDLLQEESSSEPSYPSREEAPELSDREPGNSSGTGFYVTKDGQVLTNKHVVAGCQRVTVDNLPARMVADSEIFDLALLKVDSATDTTPARFATSSARLNSDVTVVGYPLLGLLTNINVTRGSVSSMTGIQGDAFTMQISAPVQPGNSGGPVLSDAGTVVGVVVAKLDAMRVADAIGDIPQNVNFAIKGEIAKLFLSGEGVIPQLANDDEEIEPEEIAEQAGEFTVLLKCLQ